uniref:ABC transporter permease n=1 Tax=Arthrobacter sp. TaxID=1667 RepID=UPI000EB76978|nr:ABC transporter permease [Arthrobacter sp.]AXV46249.1 ABC transporter permease, FtsX-like [Arthrobacter sp.]
MKTADLLITAVQNTFRSKLRTGLTVIAIFIGAFTLTITSAIGAGISSYIDNQLGAIGAEGVLNITVAPEDQVAGSADGPAVYDPDKATPPGGLPGGAPGFPGVLSNGDIDTIAAVEGIERVEPTKLVTADFIGTETGERYQLTLNPVSAATVPDLAAGSPLSTNDTSELILPTEYVEPLGFADAQDVVGAEVVLGATNAVGTQQTLRATIVGVQNTTLLDLGASINQHLIDALDEIQKSGRATAANAGYMGAIAHLDTEATDEQVAQIKEELSAEGFRARTTEDQIGAFQTVISGIIGVLNAFAVIALIAAGFGIVNTLLMSVQERTREIGLMKAMGMGSGKVFGLFSIEAVFIGFLGSALGAAVAVGVGTLISDALADSVLSGLPGLQIMLFEPGSIAVVVLVVMLIAFIAGTLPARRAAVQNPIDALRYE